MILLIFQSECEGKAGGGWDCGGTAPGWGETSAFHGLDSGLLQLLKAARGDDSRAVHRAVCRDVKLDGDIAFLAALARASGILWLDAAAGRGWLVGCDARLRGGGGGHRGRLLGLWGRFGLAFGFRRFRDGGAQVCGASLGWGRLYGVANRRDACSFQATGETPVVPV